MTRVDLSLESRRMSKRAISIIGLLVAWRLFDFMFGPAFAILLRLLYPGLAYH